MVTGDCVTRTRRDDCGRDDCAAFGADVTGTGRQGRGCARSRPASGDGAGFITGYRAYLTEVRDRTVAEKQLGGSVDQAVAAVTAAFDDPAPDKARLAGAIRAAYAEAP